MSGAPDSYFSHHEVKGAGFRGPLCPARSTNSLKRLPSALCVLSIQERRL